ncbi:hypothetical protein PS003_23985, partial [Shigella sonnei]|nr:hypothetical protein [Shigella sonnei]
LSPNSCTLLDIHSFNRASSLYVFPESLVMLLLSVLDVKTYRDDARLNEWISNRVQELGDRYYPVT